MMRSLDSRSASGRSLRLCSLFVTAFFLVLTSIAQAIPTFAGDPIQFGSTFGYTITWTGGDMLLFESQTDQPSSPSATNIIQYNPPAGSSSYYISASGKSAGIYYYRGLVYPYSTPNYVTVALYTSFPVASTPTFTTSGSATISWTPTVPASGYSVEQQVGSSWTNASGVVTGTSYTVTGLTHGASYNFRVRPWNHTSQSPYVSSSVATTVMLTPATPVVTVPASSGNGVFNISWTAATYASGYRLERQHNGGAWTEIWSGSALSYAETLFSNGSFNYRVRACNSGGCGSYSAAAPITVLFPPTTPALIAPGSATSGSFAISWNSVGTAASYSLQQRFNSGSWNTILSSAATSFTVSNYVPGNYDFRVQACNASGCSGYSMVATVIASGIGPVSEVPAPAPVLDSASVMASDQIGATAGTFFVDKTGAASYSIPIFAVPGTAGVTPKISLNYSSDSSNGLIGQGWAIGGLSEITRCRQNALQDGGDKPITWTAQDRYCIDDMRLVPVGLGMYRKEIDDGDLFIPSGGVAGTPAYFRVMHKDGSNSFYGDAPISRDPTGSSLANTQPADGKVFSVTDATKVLSWRLRKYQDRAQNPIWYSYGYFYGFLVAEVRYAYGSHAGPDNYGARIFFTYSGRPDVFNTGYIGGVAAPSNGLRLSKITSENEGITVRQYNLTYLEQAGDAYTGPSHLSSIEECGLDNVCLSRTTQFTWNLPIAGFASSPQWVGQLSMLQGLYKFADINADGCKDIVGAPAPDERLRYMVGSCEGGGISFSNGVFTDGATSSASLAAAPFNYDSYRSVILVADFNADGRQDVGVYRSIMEPKAAHYLDMFYSEPSSGLWRLSPPSSIQITPEFDKMTNSPPFIADMNGDGLPDLVYGKGKLYDDGTRPFLNVAIRFGELDSSQTITSSRRYKIGGEQLFNDGCSLVATHDFNALIPAGDFNGDGLGDVALYLNPRNPLTQNSGIVGLETYVGSTSLGCFAARRDGWGASPSGHSSTVWPAPEAFPTEFNGDGLADINSTYAEYFSTGVDFIEKPASIGRVGDINGDGYADAKNTNYSNFDIYLWDPKLQSYSNSVYFTQNTDGRDSILQDLNGDGIVDLILTDPSSGISSIYLGNVSNRRNNAIVKIVDGLGKQITIDYENVLRSSHYQKLDVGSASSTLPQMFSWGGQPYITSDSSAFYAAVNGGFELTSGHQSLGKRAHIFELSAPRFVVTSVKKSAPATGSANLGAGSSVAMARTSYYYGEGKIEGSVRGFLGFHSIKVVDEATGLQTVTRYRQDFPFVGNEVSTHIYSNDNKLIKVTSNYWSFQNYGGGHTTPPFKPVLQSVWTSKFDPQASGNPVISSEIVNFLYDGYLNVVNMQSTSFVDASLSQVVSDVSTSFTYSGGGSAELGLPALVTTVSARPGQPPLTRKSAFSYFCIEGKPCPSNVLAGFLYESTVEPDKASYRTKTTFSYDGVGNKIQSRLTGADIVDRQTNWFYDTRAGALQRGRFVDRTINGLGQIVEDIQSRDALGHSTRSLGLNGVEIQSRFGAFGRLLLKYRNDGQYFSTLRGTSSSVCPVGTVFSERSDYSGGGVAGDCYDVLARRIRSVNVGFSGVAAYTDTEYDSAGRIKNVTEPYLSTATLKPYTSYSYDNQGRVVATKAPDGANSSTTYVGLKTTVSNPAGQNKSTTTNVIGEPILIEDHGGSSISYVYDSEGHAISIATAGADRASGVPAGPITVVFTYDDVGRKKSMNDPDKGVWSFTYNVLGQLIAQIDPKGQSVNVPLPASGASGYDALGRLVKRVDKKSDGSVEETTRWVYDIAPNGTGQLEHVEQEVSGYIKQFSYDTLGRVKTRALALSPADGGTHYEYLGYYDQFGREYKSFDASGSGVKRVFNSQGYLSQILDLSPAGTEGLEHYAILAKDADDRITQERIEGSTTRTIGFDVLGRTKQLQAGAGNVLQNLTYNYYSIGNNQYGNMEERIDNNKGLTERFEYDGLNRLTKSAVSGQPAVTVVYDSFGNMKSKSDVGSYSYGASAGPHALTSINNGAISLNYDLNGNNTAVVGDRTISYNTFDKPLQIVRGANVSSFAYGPDRDYYKRIDAPTGVKTIYLAGVEKVYQLDGKYDVRRYLSGGALIIQKYNAANSLMSTSKELILTDHLGSTDVIADAAGVLKQSMSFDSWGRRRDASNWAALTSAVDTGRTSRGFTGHVMVDGLDIIHMRGRIYDARWGRMLQADPFIPNVRSSQSFNRYSYVNNRPLMFVDPSGYKGCPPPYEGVECVEVEAGESSTAGAWASTGTNGGGGVDEGGNVSAPTLGGGVAPVSSQAPATPGEAGAGTGALKAAIATVTVTAHKTVAVPNTDIRLPKVSAPPPWLMGAFLLTFSPATATDEYEWNYAAQRAEEADSEGKSQDADRDKKRFFDKGQRDRARDRSKDTDGDPTCEYCGVKTTNEPGKSNSSQIDHIDAWSKGGRTTDENAANSCRDCNASKGARDLGTEWIPPNQR